MIQDGKNVKAGFQSLGAHAIEEHEDVTFKQFKSMFRSFSRRVDKNWTQGRQKTLIFLYYAGHGLMDNMSYAVCNPTADDKKEKYPLENSLKSLAT